MKHFIKIGKYLITFIGLFIHLGLVQLSLQSKKYSKKGLELNKGSIIQLGLFGIDID